MARKIMLVTALLVVGALLAGCGGPAKVNVSLTTYAITVDKAEIPAGEVIFTVTNDATDQVHEFVVIKTDTAADALPLDAENNVDETQFTPLDEIEDIEIGTTHDLAMTLEPGHYVLLCNTPGHYNQGMALDFEVK